VLFTEARVELTPRGLTGQEIRSTSGTGWPWRARASARPSSVSASCWERGLEMVAIGLVSVMPQACSRGTPIAVR